MKAVLRDFPAWGISLIANLSILVALHFVVFRVEAQQETTIISDVYEDLNNQQYVFSTTLTDEVGSGGDASSSGAAGGSGGGAGVGGGAVATAIGNVKAATEQKLQQSLVPRVQAFRGGEMLGLLNEVPSIGSHEDVKGDPSVNVTQGGVAGAMDRISFEIASSLKQQQTLVVWFFDASLSLNDRRAAIADRFENVYKQLEKMGAGEGLYTAVHSFGKETFLMTPEAVTIDQVKQVGDAVRKIKPDESGVEYVFSALHLALDKWKGFRRSEGRWNKLVFIVTDEKGDDAKDQLENVINLSKRFGFRCYTVGNAATFGQEKGYVRWKYADGFVEDLPVDQGPETAFPDILQVPFWGDGADWRLQRMSASYGPYALTRLCAETGGMYLVAEDTAGGYKFDPIVMRNYAPDYRPVRSIEQEIAKNPAKRALVEAAGSTYAANVPNLETTFFADNDNTLRQEITEAQRPAADTEFWVDKVLGILKQGETARDSLREARWRASFDLAMGRIIAMKVRLKGYNLMLAQMKGTPKTFTKKGGNEWKIVAAKEIDTGPQMRKAAEEARKYLKRVIDEHPGTPWEKLAVKELSEDVGWAWQESIRYVPGMENSDLNPEEVRLLLAEEERRQQQRRMQEKPREKPKL